MGDPTAQLIENLPELVADADVRSFKPEWRGFSTSPAGSLCYADLGACGLMWTEAARIGESNAATFGIANVPAAIRPTTSGRSTCYLIDAGELVMGGWQLDASGVMTFEIMRVADPTAPRSTLTPDARAFTPHGLKGLARPFATLFPKPGATLEKVPT
jgi:hypothetical protein